MSYFRVYINPRDDNGNLTDYQEVTNDVDFNGFSNISENLDNDEYNVGSFKFNSFRLNLTNEHGKYSDVETVASIFRYRRGGSKVKVNWQIQDYQSICGVAIAGKAKLTPEVTVFEGILNDDATRLDIQSQKISFSVIGIDSIFNETETPYSSLTNGDLFSEALLAVLDQAKITEYLTVSASNISVSLDLAIDDVSPFENTTVKESLDQLLFSSNSVLYIKNNVVYITSRDPQGSSVKTFYGQGSQEGIESIIKISNISTGRNKVFNYWTWADTALVSQSSTSIEDNGLRKKEISFDAVTNSSKRQSILDSQKTEFSDLKQEFSIDIELSYENIEIDLLNVIKIDYSTPLISSSPGSEVPIYGLGIYGEASYPVGFYSILIDESQNFKVIGKSINTKNQVLTLNLREV
ncbi:MAG: hypothetical protein KDD61_09130 [Bdellovibrionales bacterium]|nr:hypothetical protein [Bdellovibrionales bacterium]